METAFFHIQKEGFHIKLEQHLGCRLELAVTEVKGAEIVRKKKRERRRESKINI